MPRASMSPSLLPPTSKLSPPTPSFSPDSDNPRKRVCKACDRCRLKKSKCDGSHPCSRCKADNAICVFGERKRSHDKIYPRGYVEMLEQQQSQLVAGLQELYRRSLAGRAWSGAVLPEVNGQPLTHDILAAMNLLEINPDGTWKDDGFEEDCEKLQDRLMGEGAGFAVRRRGSASSDSEHSRHAFDPARVMIPRRSMDNQHLTLRKDSSSIGNSPSPSQISPSHAFQQPFAPPQQASSLLQQPVSFSPSYSPDEAYLYQPNVYGSDATTGPARSAGQMLAYSDVDLETNRNMMPGTLGMSDQQDFIHVPGFAEQFPGGFGSNTLNWPDMALDPKYLDPKYLDPNYGQSGLM